MAADVFARRFLNEDPRRVEFLCRRARADNYAAAPRRLVGGDAERARNRLSRYRRQSVRTPNPRFFGRQNARAIARLHLFVSRSGRQNLRLRRPRASRPPRRRLPRFGLYGGQIRSARQIRRVRSAPTAAGGDFAGAAFRARDSRRRRRRLRFAFRLARANDGGGGDSIGARIGAVFAAVVRGADAARMPGRRGRGRRARHRFRSRPASGCRRRTISRAFWIAARRRFCSPTWGAWAESAKQKKSPPWPRCATPKSRRICIAARSRRRRTFNWRRRFRIF